MTKEVATNSDTVTSQKQQGKTEKDENFPVGSFLISPKLRPHILAYYRFARLADDIADDAKLSPKQKLNRLDALEKVLLGQTKATEATFAALALRKSLEITKITPMHATDLLEAFRKDAQGFKYENWFDLMNYCRYSAAPVGRYMLDLHEQPKATYWPSDMLCSALQILNHIQDMNKDRLELGRIYFPENILINQGLSYDDLASPFMTEKLQIAVGTVLDLTEGLLKESVTLPLLISNRGLRMEVCTIHNLALRLLSRLRKEDILAEHIELTKTDWLKATLSGIGNGLCAKKISLPKK